MPKLKGKKRWCEEDMRKALADVDAGQVYVGRQKAMELQNREVVMNQPRSQGLLTRQIFRCI